ncbi:sensor histidine kinase [Edaphobacter bradus]|uniref:sensor histidine kinase n=1 Tax=Edaphobacter bradus TaxID=2259016 RepID=UPI0021DF4561|nr:sensor histidine kinase [Edaphobacter bradus]
MSGTIPISTQRWRNWTWIWLAYTGFLFIDPIFEPSLRLWLATLAAFVTFLGIFAAFVRLSDEGRPARYWMIAATFLLGLITFPWNPGASSFFIYAAAFLPFSIESTRRALALFVAGSVLIVAEGYYFNSPGHLFHIHWPNVFIAIFLLMVIGCGNIVFAEQKRADCKLRAAQEENVALAAAAERERIARDLHDVLGHTLSVIVLKAELARRLMQLDPQRAAEEIADVETTARTALAEVREAIGGYRSQGLAAELAQARRTLDAAGVTFTWEAPPEGLPALTPTEETVLSLSVREAVTNIVRHAEATHCTMRLATTSDGYYALLVEDDGRHAIRQEGNGLRGMRERVSGLGGRFSIRWDRGTHLLIELPITSQQGTPA